MALTEKQIKKIQIDGLNKLIEMAGSQEDLANILTEKMGYKIRQSLISSWKTKIGKVSPRHVVPICEHFDYKIKPYDLRPDIFPKWYMGQKL